MEARTNSPRGTKQLRREIYEFFSKDDISTATDLFNQIIYDMLNISLVNEKDYRFGLNLFGSEDEKQYVTFSIPEIKWPQVKILLAFFNIQTEEYVPGKPLKLDVDYVFDHVLPGFKKHYQLLLDEKSEMITKAKVESRGILENEAVDSIRQYTQEAINIILPKKTSEPEGIMELASQQLFTLKAQLGNLRINPLLYKKMIACTSTLEFCLESPEMEDKPGLKQKLSRLVEALENFKKYHRTDAVMANLTFFKEMKHYLALMKISASQCDVIEDSILRLAEIETGKKAECKIRIGHDESRLVFDLIDINKENTQKLIQYLRDHGDETVIEGYGNVKHGHAIPESLECFAMNKERGQKCLVISNEPRLERHCVETDGKFFHDVMLPKLMSEISAHLILDPELLKKYQELSADYFEEKERKAKVSGKLKLFGVNDPIGLMEVEKHGFRKSR